MNVPVNAQVIKFREFALDRDRYELRRNGRAVKLEKMPMELLILLASKRGNLVTRQEIIECLWGLDVYIDSEHGINTVVRKLRQALRDDPEKPRFVETVTGKGYRFVAETIVEEEEPAAVESRAEDMAAAPVVELGQVETDHVETQVETKRAGTVVEVPDVLKVQRRWLLGSGVALAIAVGAVVWYLSRPLPSPRITEFTPITHDGHRKWLMATDGSRLFFNQLESGTVAQVAVSGGEIAQIPIALPNPEVCCVSPDGTTLLVASGANGSLWSDGSLGGSLRRLTMSEAPSEDWSPDGKTIVYTTTDGGIYLARSDGTDARKLASAGGFVRDISWSPDGSKFRFSKDNTLWEISATGSDLHRLLPNWPSGHCCGRWTPDGNFFVFLSGLRNTVGTTALLSSQIWIIDERRELIRGPSPIPLQLTSGPMGWRCIVPSRDGKAIFATGLTARGELVRFDARSRQLQPYMGGISAEFVSYSRDGRSVAYVTYPDGSLWRANGDGSGRVQLGGAPAYPKAIRWSPDGARLAFSAVPSSKDNDALYITPAQGGNSTRITSTDSASEYDPTWSPDGDKIVFFANRTGDLRIVDLASHQITPLPGSAGMFSPRWSSDGRSIVAMTIESDALKIFDLATQRWSTLLRHEGMSFPNWSHDDRYVYILYLSDNPGVYRVRATGGDAERVVDLSEFHHTGTVNYWFGLDPTDAPLLLRDAGTDDIYGLRLESK